MSGYSGAYGVLRVPVGASVRPIPAPVNTAAAVAARRDGRDLAARVAAPWWRLTRWLMPGRRS